MMNNLAVLCLTVLLPVVIQGSRGGPSSWRTMGGPPHPDAERFTAETSHNHNHHEGRKITVMVDEDVGKALDNLEKIEDIQRDVKDIKDMLEGLVKHNGLEVENLVDPRPKDNRGVYSSTSSFGSQGSSRPSYSRTSSSGGSSSSGWRGSRNASSDNRRGNQEVPPYTPKWGVTLPKHNCAELRLSGIRKSGVYTIQPDKNIPAFEVYCDMDTDDGGWTVIQRRGVINVPKAVRENFYRSWTDYEDGFGNPRSDHWLGLDKINAMTHNCNHELMVNITGWDNASKFARYGNFNISGPQDHYKLHIANYTGNAGDGLIQHDKMKFSTYDKQNDFNGDENCAELYRGGWWYKDCFWSNLNGEYADDGSNGIMKSRSGVEWGTRHFYSYMKTEMKIKPRC